MEQNNETSMDIRKEFMQEVVFFLDKKAEDAETLGEKILVAEILSIINKSVEIVDE